MTLEELEVLARRTPEDQHMFLRGATVLKLLELITTLRAGLAYVDGFATGYLEIMGTHQGFHKLLTKMRGLAERVDEIERSL